VAGRPRTRPDSLTGNRAYGGKANQAVVTPAEGQGGDPAASGSHRKSAAEGICWWAPPQSDARRYKRRNQVERGYNRRKQFRALATRYDKLGLHLQATNDSVETIDWTRATPDKSRYDQAATP